MDAATRRLLAAETQDERRRLLRRQGQGLAESRRLAALLTACEDEAERRRLAKRLGLA
jgi:hypothetical protein